MGPAIRGRWARATIRLLSLAARPARKARGNDGIVVEPYRGYGSREAIFLIGRVFRQARAERDADAGDVRAHLRNIARRIRRRKVVGARLTAQFLGTRQSIETDKDGYFRLHLRIASSPDRGREWHPVDLTLDADPPVHLQGEVFIPPERCRFVVISDIDDTVMRTGVANKAKMLWRLFVADAQERVAFPGAAALYRALHAGVGGDEANPMLYVSRAPWGIYEMLSEFFRLHDIPAGPILFLREWGLSWRHPLPRRAEDHKGELIAHMLDLYRDLPFVLIGDSGQHDPEVYARIVEAHPGRIHAVYIRDVSRGGSRRDEIARLADAVAAAGSHLVLAADSTAIAEHAAGLRLIARDAAARVAAERETDTAEDPAPTRHVSPPEADADGSGLDDLLAAETPTNVVVAPPIKEHRRRRES